MTKASMARDLNTDLCTAFRQHSSLELQFVFEAAWATTSMAAGPHDSVKAVLPSAPMLNILVQSCSSMHIAEQAAWALGELTATQRGLRSVSKSFFPTPSATLFCNLLM